MEPLARPETLTSVVVNHFAEAIVRGDLAAGAQLAEVPLAKELNTSRGTVREALRELEGMGLVDILPHRGAFVSELTPRRAEEIFSLRAVLEAFAGRLVLERHGPDPEILAAMEDAIEAQRAAADTSELLPWVEADMQFHRRLSSYCDHELLLAQLSALQTQTRRFLVSVKLYGADLIALVDSHRPIVDALATGDPAKLEQAVHDHVTSSGRRLIDRMRETGDAGA